MSKRSVDEKLDVQSQKKVKFSSQEIEVGSNAQQTQVKVSPIFSICIFIFKTMDSRFVFRGSL
jgi:hypothetical protein